MEKLLKDKIFHNFVILVSLLDTSPLLLKMEKLSSTVLNNVIKPAKNVFLIKKELVLFV